MSPRMANWPALLDLVHALVAAGHELLRGLVEVDQLLLLDGEAVGAQRRVGHLLRQRHRRGHHHRALAVEQRVQGRDPQAHEVGRRGQVGLVLDPAGGVQAHLAGAEERPQVGCEVAGRAVVPGHHQRRPVGLGVEQRGEQERPQAGGHESALGSGLRGLAESANVAVLAGVVSSERRDTGRQNGRPGPRAATCPSVGGVGCRPWDLLRPAEQSNVLLIVGIILGLLLPIGGLIIAVILFATGRAQQGLYVILATLLGMLLAFAALPIARRPGAPARRPRARSARPPRRAAR